MRIAGCWIAIAAASIIEPDDRLAMLELAHDIARQFLRRSVDVSAEVSTDLRILPSPYSPWRTYAAIRYGHDKHFVTPWAKFERVHGHPRRLVPSACAHDRSARGAYRGLPLLVHQQPVASDDIEVRERRLQVFIVASAFSTTAV